MYKILLGDKGAALRKMRIDFKVRLENYCNLLKVNKELKQAILHMKRKYPNLIDGFMFNHIRDMELTYEHCNNTAIETAAKLSELNLQIYKLRNGKA